MVDEKADAELLLLDDQHARNLYDMGFDVWIEGGKWKHSDRPTEKRQPQVFQPPPGAGADMATDVGTHRPGSGVPSDKGERCPGGHSHGDYGDGRCHPEEQHHRDGEHREERGGRREQQPSPQGEEERKAAVLKRIEGKGVKVVEKEQAHPNVLEHVDAGFEEAIEKGDSLPREIVIDSRFVGGSGQKVLNTPMAYDPNNDTLYLNPRSFFFQGGMINAKKFMERGFQSNLFSSGNALHVLRHELSHIEHIRHYPEALEIKEFAATDPRPTISKEVGLRASMNPQEFVAEVRAALLDGRKFSDEVMKLYEHYSGGMRS